MPNYYKKRRTTSKNSASTSADWQGLAYYSIIGVLVYIGFMAIRSLSLGTGNRSSFADWLKSIFNIFEAWNTGTGSGTGTSDSSETPDLSGFENTDLDNQGGQDLYSQGIKDTQYFKASEYFGNYAKPTDPTLINNYNRLISDLDLIRKTFGSAVTISAGYKAGSPSMFQNCTGVHIKASNGNNQALNNTVVALRKSNQITGTSVYMEDSGETRYYIK